MYNEEGNDQYTEVENGTGNGSSNFDYEDEEEEFQKIRKEHVFAEIDFTKRKSKIVCTLG
jgi:hypothetical protein